MILAVLKSVFIGLGQGSAAFVAVNLTGTFKKIGFTLTGYDLLVYILVSGITSYLEPGRLSDILIYRTF